MGDVHNDNSAGYRRFYLTEKPGSGGGITRTERFEHYALQSLDGQHGVHNVLRHTRIQFEHHHVGTEIVIRREVLCAHVVMNVVMGVGNVDADIGQSRIIGRMKGIKLFGTQFFGTVAAQQFGLEIHTDLGHHGLADLVAGCSHLDGSDEVFLTIGA